MKHPLLAKSCITLISLGVLIAGANSGVAQETDIGSVAAANPTIEGTPPNANTRVLKLGTRIFENEIISTSKIGSGQFIFLDQTTLTVSPGSEIVLDRYVFDATSGAGEIVLTLSKGVLRFIGGRITKGSEGIINTPHATIGIRGGIAAITVGKAGTNAVLLAGESMRVTGGTKTIIVTRTGGMVTVPAPESESSETAGEDAVVTEADSSDPAAAETETTETETTETEVTEPVATEPVTADLGEPVYVGVITADELDLIYESTDTGGDGGTTETIEPEIVTAAASTSGLTDIGADAPGSVEDPPISTDGTESPDNADDSSEPDPAAPDPIEDIATDPDTTDPVEDLPDDPLDILPLATSDIPNTWSPSVPITHAFTGGYAAGLGQSTIPGTDPGPYVMRSPDGDGVIMGFDAAGNAVFAEFGPLDTFGSADIDDITLNFGSGASSVAFLDDNVFSIDAPDSETGALTGQTQSISGFSGTDPIGGIQTAMVGTVTSSGFEGDRGIFPAGTDTTPEFLRWGWWAADYQFDEASDSPGGVAPRSETLEGSWVSGVRTDDIAVLGTSGEAQFRGLATAHVTGGSGPELQGGSFTLIYDLGDRSGDVSITGIAGTTFVSTVTGSPTGSGNHFRGALLDFSKQLVGSIDGSFFTGAGDLTAATGGAFDFTRQIPGDATVTQTGAGIFAADKD